MTNPDSQAVNRSVSSHLRVLLESGAVLGRRAGREVLLLAHVRR